MSALPSDDREEDAKDDERGGGLVSFLSSTVVLGRLAKAE